MLEPGWANEKEVEVDSSTCLVLVDTHRVKVISADGSNVVFYEYFIIFTGTKPFIMLDLLKSIICW